MARHKYKYVSEPDVKAVRKKKILIELFIWLVELLLVIGVAYYISFFMLEKTSVIGSSMESTLEDGDQILIHRMAYRFHKPERFDVIVYKQSNKEHSYYDVKRVIGLPGETVQIDDNGKIFINGEALIERVIVDPMNNNGLAAGDGMILDEGEYFVLGDNRNASEDSRFASIGNIIESDIVGKAWIKLHPFSFISELNLGRE